MSAFIGLQLRLIEVSGLGGFFSSANGFTASGTESGGGTGGIAGLAVATGLVAAAVGAVTDTVAAGATAAGVAGGAMVMVIGGGGVVDWPHATGKIRQTVDTPTSGSSFLMVQIANKRRCLIVQSGAASAS